MPPTVPTSLLDTPSIDVRARRDAPPAGPVYYLTLAITTPSTDPRSRHPRSPTSAPAATPHPRAPVYYLTLAITTPSTVPTIHHHPTTAPALDLQSS